MSKVFWQMFLMVLLGASGIVFLPFLIREVPADLMAMLLMTQAFVYYLALFVQYGFQWSGPAVCATLTMSSQKTSYWKSSIRLKLWIAVFAITILLLASKQSEVGMVGIFAILLLAFAVNSNWFLQTHDDFKTAPLVTAAGVLISLVILGFLDAEVLEPNILIILAASILVMPQVFLGLSTWIAVKSRYGVQYSPDVEANDFGLLTLFKRDLHVVLSQFLLLLTTTIGTLIVGYSASAETTTAYSATEKLFNLGVTLSLALFSAFYPKLARLFVANKELYRSYLWRYVASIWFVQCCGFVALWFFGPWGLSLYIGPSLSALISPTIVPFYLSLMLFICQPALMGHLVLSERKSTVLRVNMLMLLVTLVVGVMATRVDPLYWVYGLLAGQLSVFVTLLVVSPPRLVFGK